MPPAQKLISGQRRCCGGVARGGSICRLVSAVSDTSCRCSVSSSCWTDSDRRAEYCDDRVCMAASLSVSISSPDIHIRSLPDFLCTWYTYGRGSVLLGWRRDTLLTSGLMYYMIFAHNPRQLSVVAQIIEAQPTWAWLKEVIYSMLEGASRRRLLPAVSPAAGHLTTPTVAGLPGLCENFRPTTSMSSPV